MSCIYHEEHSSRCWYLSCIFHRYSSWCTRGAHWSSWNLSLFITDTVADVWGEQENKQSEGYHSNIVLYNVHNIKWHKVLNYNKDIQYLLWQLIQLSPPSPALKNLSRSIDWNGLPEHWYILENDVTSWIVLDLVADVVVIIAEVVLNGLAVANDIDIGIDVVKAVLTRVLVNIEFV